MIGEIKNPLAKITKDRLVIGLDITDEFSQISYGYITGEEPKTLSTRVEGDNMCIPTVLGKYYSQNVWTFGEKAVEMAQNNEGYIVSDLLDKARKGTAIEVEGRDYDPVDLLALYLKKLLSLLAMVAPLEKVSAIVITLSNPDNTNIEIFTRAVNTLRIKAEKVYFQGYSESIFHYIIHQKKELWNHDVLVCHLGRDGLTIRDMKVNHTGSPKVVMMDEKYYSTITATMLEDGKESTKRNLDTLFEAAVKTFTMDNYVSSVYLLGEGFEQQWYQETLKYLCQNRRVFSGNNLFSKGAAYGARERLGTDEEATKYVFLGKDKVRSNVGIAAMKDGEETYIPLLEAGRNWYETSRECEFIVDGNDDLGLIVTPLNGQDSKLYKISLDEFPARPAKSTRIKLDLKMTGERLMSVSITDLGFGEFFPPTGIRIKRDIVLD